jgi:hypothetical protein
MPLSITATPTPAPSKPSSPATPSASMNGRPSSSQ